MGLLLKVTNVQTIAVYCWSFSCMFRLVQNWSLSICRQTYLSKRGEGFKDVEVLLLKNQVLKLSASSSLLQFTMKKHKLVTL